MYGILHHLFSIVYFLLWHTISNLFYFCILILCSSVYLKGLHLPAEPGSELGQSHLCFLSSLQTTSRWWWSITGYWNVHICQSPVQLSSICENLHEALISSRLFSSNCPCPVVHCVNPELCCTNFTSHWYAVIVKTTPKPKTFSSLLLQVNPRNWMQQNLMQSNPKRHYILMLRFWLNFPNSGCKEGGDQWSIPTQSHFFVFYGRPSIPFDLNKTLPPSLSLTAALWFQRGQLMHFVSTTGNGPCAMLVHMCSFLHGDPS